MEYKLVFLDKTYIVNLKKEKDSCKGFIDNKEYSIRDYSISGNAISVKMQESRMHFYIAVDKTTIYLVVNGEAYTFELTAGQKQKTKASIDIKGNSVASPMPGLLVSVPVKVGDRVQAKTTLAIVEAMKMQNELRSPCNGLVISINYREGDQVDAFKPIVVLEPDQSK